ncbi:hypothetical protein [Sphingomonas sp. LY160]|uniref:hypothetical protein n=1 Tax=Sphingomonas sp. LY160 TaxID=3095342 RepID=UPI002ADEC14F|nr:hypothetical protein [Sphingomonas sp. LY160]MEA1072651.1 hypothetical protein [Sphingomonas sp. LY160]
MTPLPLPENFAADASWLVQAFDYSAGLARLVRLDVEGYRQASFLDDRMLSATTEARLVALGDVVDAGALFPSNARWIFHIGHVGSTLVARLLGEGRKVLSVREPRALRDLLAAPESERRALADSLSRLAGRSFAPEQATVVKATSFVSEAAPRLVGPDMPALFMLASARSYICTILAGPNSVQELRTLDADRRRRLATRGIHFAPDRTSDAHLAAIAWACEMTALEAAEDSIGRERVQWLDFDRFLEAPKEELANAAKHLRLALTEVEMEDALAGPVMRRYSKAMEYDYTPALRADLLAEAGRAHARDIDAALALLAETADNAPLLKRALGRTQGA